MKRVKDSFPSKAYAKLYKLCIVILFYRFAILSLSPQLKTGFILCFCDSEKKTISLFLNTIYGPNN